MDNECETCTSICWHSPFSMEAAYYATDYMKKGDTNLPKKHFQLFQMLVVDVRRLYPNIHTAPDSESTYHSKKHDTSFTSKGVLLHEFHSFLNLSLYLKGKEIATMMFGSIGRRNYSKPINFLPICILVITCFKE